MATECYQHHYPIVLTLPGKPGSLSFTFPGLENVRNLLKKWEKPAILTQNIEKT